MWEFLFGFFMGKQHHARNSEPIEDDEIMYIPSYFIRLEHYGSLVDDDDEVEIVFDRCYVQVVSTHAGDIIYVQREKRSSANFTRTCYGCTDADLCVNELKKDYPEATVKRASEPIWINVLKENKTIVLQTDTFKYEGIIDYAKSLDKQECQKLLMRARHHYEKYGLVKTRYMEDR